MKIKRALDIRTAARMRLSDLFRQAEHFGFSSETLSTRRAAIMAELPPRTPQWVRVYLDGYHDAKIAQLYEYGFLVYGGKVGEVFYSTHRDRADYYEKHGIEPSAYANNGLVQYKGHYWRNSLRPFFVA